MTGPIRWGILGTGWIAEQFVTDILANGITVTAVGSRSQGSADAFAERFGIPTAHGSYEALAADPEVDVVYVATPHPMHADNATLVLNAGKHALVEKPFTLNAAEAQRVVDLASAKNLVVLEAMWTRWLPHMVRLREILAAGTIGDVRTVIADHNQKLPSDPKHRINAPELGGGALLDLGIYPVSFAWDVLGEPQSTVAISSPTATGVDRQTAILFGYADGQQAVLHTALDTAGPNTASVIGTDGWIALRDTFYAPTNFTVFDSAGTVVEEYVDSVEQRGMQFQAWETERLIAAGTPAGEILSPSETVGIMGSLDEVRRQIGLVYPGE
ncbi:putative dehydrogenase [Conyzicola nivalis]|uniref:Dehydrogenase n=1 Tax=Conyzicola nivalis TaxID=1477021 RepID=A0ABV2QRC7_9MICO